MIRLQKVINPFGKGQSMYQHSIVELTVSKTLFFPSALIPIRCYDKKF